MTDLNTNQYLYKQAYLQNQPNYGDGKGGFPISYDDKRLDPIKGNLKTNPVGKVIEGTKSSSEKKDSKEGFMKMPIIIALGTIPTLLIDKACRTLIKGDSFKESSLGKIVDKVDNFSNAVTSRVPALKFDWAKTAFDRIKNGDNILSQIIKSKPAKPVLGMAKGMVMPQQDGIIKEMLEEAISISGKNSDAYKAMLQNLENGIANSSKEAYKEAIKLAKKANPSEKFLMLKNRAHSLSNMSKHSPLSKLLISAYNSVNKVINIGKIGPGVQGKLGFLFGLGMTAYFLGETVKKTIDAPKKEKGSTLAHGVIVDFIGGWLLFEPITKFMYKGLGALKEVKGKGLSKIITTPLNLLGKFLNAGLNMPAIPKATTNLGVAGNAFKQAGQHLRGFGGGATRFALMMFVLFPVMDKISRFVSHSLFGKPKTLLAKEKAEAEAGNSENKENNTEALKKALEQNKAGMLTVASKTDTSSSMTEKFMKQHVENLSKNSVQASEKTPSQNNADKISETKSDIQESDKNENNKAISSQNPFKKQNEGYMPSDTRTSKTEEKQKKEKFNSTLAAADKAIKEAEKTVKSV